MEMSGNMENSYLVLSCPQCGSNEFNTDIDTGTKMCKYCNTTFVPNPANEHTSIKKLDNAELYFHKFNDKNIAIKYYKEAINLDPGNFRGWWGLAKVKSDNFTNLSISMMDFSEVKELVEKAILTCSGEVKERIKNIFHQYEENKSSYDKLCIDYEQKCKELELIKKEQEKIKKDKDKLNKRIKEEKLNSSKVRIKYNIALILLSSVLIIVFVIISSFSQNMEATYFWWIFIIAAIIIFLYNLVDSFININKINNMKTIEKEINNNTLRYNELLNKVKELEDKKKEIMLSKEKLNH